MTQKLYIKTYGCQMNEYDSSRIKDLFIASGNFSVTEKPESADIILLNTCSIREKAQEKVFSDLGRYRLLKTNKPSLIIGVGGCVATQEGKTILKRAPYVNIIFGPLTLHRLLDMVKSVKEHAKPIIDISSPHIEKFDHLPKSNAKNPTTSITIMEGCNNFCSYCIVPYTRGREISRPFSDLLDEIKIGIGHGSTEITLLGQNVNNYKDPTTHKDLADLIYTIAENPKIKRIRFITSNPFNFPEKLIQTFSDIPKLASHLHLPVQSGSDRILKAMRRRHTHADYRMIVRQLRDAKPNICISSDFIVGFPNETDDDFEDTLNLIRDIGFDRSFSFIYSPRPGTPAEKLEDNVPLSVKKERLAILQQELLCIDIQISEKMIGTNQTVLVTGKSRKSDDELTGRTENNRIVNFPGASHLINHFVDVTITEVFQTSLRGKQS